MTAAGRRLTDAQLVDWLRLIRSENIGPRTFRELVNRYGGASAALEALPEVAKKTLRGRTIKIATREEVLREIDAATKLGARFVTTADQDYPALLREIHDAPPVLSVRGALDVGPRDGVALVGSRNASAVGWRLRKDSRARWRLRNMSSCPGSRAGSTRSRIARR